MKLIFIRGLPGTGKTSIAEILKEHLPNSEIITVDYFKLGAMKDGENFENAKRLAYRETIRKLNEFYLMQKDFIIVDELICEKKFFMKLREFLDKTNSKSYWFRITRKLKYLLEIEAERDRKIKNSIEDFEKLKKDIEKLKIPNEVLLKNDDLDLTIQGLKNILSKT